MNVSKLMTIVMFAVALVACGGSGKDSGSGGGNSSTPAITKYTYSTKLYIAQKGSNDVRVLNALTEENITNIPVGLGPIAVTVDDTVNKAYVANGGEKTISVIDTLTHKVIATLPTADKPLDLAIDPASQRLYASLANNTVQVFNTITQTSVTSIAVDAGTLKMAIDTVAKRLYVLGSGSIKVLDTATNTVTATLAGNVNNPYLAIGINPKLKRLYVGNLTAALHIFDTANNTEIAAPQTTLSFINDVLVNPNDGKVYLGSIMGIKVGVLDANGTALPDLVTQAGRAPERLVINTRSNYLYIANSSFSELQISQLEGTYQKRYTVTSAPSALAIVKPSAPTPQNMPVLPPAGGFGDSWKLLTANFNSVAFGNGLYVAVGDRGVIQTSPDGVNWTQRLSSGTSGEPNLYKVIFAGGRFVAVGDANSILTSTDGITWIATYSGGGGNLYGVAWSGTHYLAVGPDSMNSSVDGITWTRSNAFAMTPTVTWLFDPVWDNTRFLISGIGIFSDGGSNGAAVGKLMNAQGTSYIQNMGGGVSMVKGPNAGTFVSVVSGPALQTSSWQYTNDGLNSPVPLSSVITITQDGGLTKYVPPEMARSDGNEWNMVSYNPILNLYVAVGGAGGSRSAKIYTGTTLSNRIYQTPAANGIIATSPDGMTWTQRTNPLSQALFGVSYNTTTGEMIAVGELGAIITSIDGVTWTARSGNDTSLPVSAGKLTTFNEVIWGGPGAGMFVAIGDAGALYTSINGTNWTKISVNTTSNFAAITWGGLPGQQKFVATLNTNSPTIWAYTSSDGITWTPVARPAAANGGLGGGALLSIVWNGSMFVGSDLYDFYDSVDGINWRFSSSHTPFIPSGSSYQAPILRYDAQAKKFISIRAWSHSATIGMVDRGTDIRISGDAVNWESLAGSTFYRNDALFDFSGDFLLTSGAVEYGTYQVLPVTGESSLIEAGSNGPTGIPFAPTKMAMISDVSLCMYTSCNHSGVYTNRMINTGTLIVGAGSGGIYTKSDTGLNWTRQSSGATYTSVAWNGSVFVAVGTNTIAVSR